MSISSNAPKAKEKLTKLMARSGLCSRRKAEEYIRAGRVSVNRDTVTNPAETASIDDAIYVDGEKLSFPKMALWLFHKPPGYLVSRQDVQNRPTIFEHPTLKLLEKDGRQLLNIGRLDMTSEGLLLLCNDGMLKNYLEKSDLPRIYHVRYFGGLDKDKLRQLQNGARIDGVNYGNVTILHQEKFSVTKRNHWIKLQIHEGKNREIRKMINWCGAEVSRLIRTDFGEFSLADLPKGAAQKIPEPQTIALWKKFAEPNNTKLYQAKSEAISPTKYEPDATMPRRKKPGKKLGKKPTRHANMSGKHHAPKSH